VRPPRWLLLAFIVAGSASPPRAAAQGALFPRLPGWTLSPPPGDSVYTPDNLWDIIDGGAELFLSYGFVDLRIGEYTDSAGTDVRVELYRHSSGANAFGMYSQERSPGSHFVTIGTEGYVEDKVLNFLSGLYYVKISSHRGGAPGIDAMVLIGGRVAEHLHQESGFPPPLAYFPSDRMIPHSESYIAENFLGYGALRRAFTARYEGGCTMFIMECESAPQAREAAQAFLKVAAGPQKLEERIPVECTDQHNGPIRLVLSGRRLGGVFGIGTKALGHRYVTLLQTALTAAEK
jgi:hypothetical protein